MLDRLKKNIPFFLLGRSFAQVASTYLAIAKDGVVDHDTMDASILVGLYDLVLKVVAGTCAKLKLDTGIGTCLCGPLGVLGSSGILVGKEPDQLGTDVAGLDCVLELLSVVSKVEGRRTNKNEIQVDNSQHSDGLSFLLELGRCLWNHSFTCRRLRCLEREQPCRTLCMRMYVGWGNEWGGVGWEWRFEEDEIKELRRKEKKKTGKLIASPLADSKFFCGVLPNSDSSYQKNKLLSCVLCSCPHSDPRTERLIDDGERGKTLH